MTLRAGSYDRSEPRWTGLIRDDGLPVYRCIHTTHKNRAEARECARLALDALKGTGHLPRDEWVHYLFRRDR